MNVKLLPVKGDPGYLTPTYFAYSDGSRVQTSLSNPTKWIATKPGHNHILDPNGFQPTLFDTAEDAARALYDLGFGPKTDKALNPVLSFEEEYSKGKECK